MIELEAVGQRQLVMFSCYGQSVMRFSQQVLTNPTRWKRTCDSSSMFGWKERNESPQVCTETTIMDHYVFISGLLSYPRVYSLGYFDAGIKMQS